MAINDVHSERALRYLRGLLEEHEAALRELRALNAVAMPKSNVSLPALRAELEACIPAPRVTEEGLLPSWRRFSQWVTRLFRGKTADALKHAVKRSEMALLTAYARVCEEPLPVCVSSMLLRHFRMLKGATYVAVPFARSLSATVSAAVNAPMSAPPVLAPIPLAVPVPLRLPVKRDFAVGSGA